MLMKNSDEFTKEIKKFGNSLGIIIPDDMVKFTGLEAGDIIKVEYKIVKKKNQWRVRQKCL